MVLTGLLALALALLWPEPAHAEPISISILAALAISQTATAIAVTTFIITTAISMALSFVASALLKPPGKSSGTGDGGGSQSTLDNKVTIRQAAASAQIVYGLQRVAGIMGLVHSTEGNKYLHLIVMLAGHECYAFHTVCINDEWFEIGDLDGDGFVQSGQYADKVRFKFHLGSATQTADTTLMAEAPDIWTANDRLRGICYMYVRLEWDRKVFAGGIPNLTALIHGKNDIPDPRLGTTGYKSNSALIVANYLCDTTYGLGIDYATGIDATALTAAANACDESVTIAAGGTEQRYTTEGVVSSSSQPQEILGLLLGAMHGRSVYDGETWKIIAGVYQSPTITLGENDLRGGLKIQTLTSRRDLFNAVKGTFFGPENNFQEADFPPVVSSAYAAQDGQTIWKDIKLPFTLSPSRCQRIAKIDLLRARQQIVVTAPCKLTAWLCQAGDTVNLTFERYGWTAKPFEVTRARFVPADDGTLGIDLTLVETVSTIYSWETSEESTIDEAPNTTLPDAFNPLGPSNLVIDESIYDTRSSAGVKARATLGWASSADAFVSQYEPGWRPVGGDWATLPRVSGLSTVIDDIAPGTYEFRVASVNVMGAVSDYISTTQEISGLLDPPAVPANLTVTVMGGAALLRWDPTVDLDVQQGGKAVLRHSPASSGATWDTATPIGGDEVPGSDTSAWAPLKAGTYLVKFRDSSGVYSTTAATAYTPQVALKAFTTPSGGTLTEDPTFGGTKTNCSVSSSKLKLTGGNATGSYAWSAFMDIGSVKSVRLTTGLTAQVVNNTDSWDSTELTDSEESWDVAVSGNEADAKIYVATTPDDPAGTPTWSAWNRLDSAEYSARGFKFRTDLAAYDLQFGLEVSAMSVIAEEST